VRLSHTPLRQGEVRAAKPRKGQSSGPKPESGCGPDEEAVAFTLSASSSRSYWRYSRSISMLR